jgi:hypothetical protein
MKTLHSPFASEKHTSLISGTKISLKSLKLYIDLASVFVPVR